MNNDTVNLKPKLRTPSGNQYRNLVKERRTIFSPTENLSGKGVNSQQTESAECKESGIVKGIHAWLIHSSNPQPKQTVDNHAEGDKHDQSDSESDFATPPVTPVRVNAIKTKALRKQVGNRGKLRSDKASEKSSKLDKFLKMAQSTANQQSEDNSALKSDSEGATSDGIKPISNELAEMMANYQGDDTQVMEVAVVHTMFKKLKENFERRLQQIKVECLSTADQGQLSKNLQENTLSLKQKVSNMELEEDILKCAIYKINESVDELTDRMKKIELDGYKKMITITGLYVDPDDTAIARRQVDAFIAENLGINVRIESCYPVGTSMPPTLIVTLHSVREKDKIMKNKKSLKGVHNPDGKPYYINNYYLTDSLEKRRHYRQMIKQNEEAGEEKVQMETYGNALLIDGQKYVCAIQPPNVQQILDMSIEEVQEVVNTKLENGPAIEKDDNKFIGYTICVKTLKEIQNANMRLRLSHPKARHIMCAFRINDEAEPYYNRSGCCDDGEHGASVKLLEILEGNAILQRAVFVVRYYSGKKLGPARFTCITEAAEECIKLNPFNSILNAVQELYYDEELSQEDMQEGRRSCSSIW